MENLVEKQIIEAYKRLNSLESMKIQLENFSVEFHLSLNYSQFLDYFSIEYTHTIDCIDYFSQFLVNKEDKEKILDATWTTYEDLCKIKYIMFLWIKNVIQDINFLESELELQVSSKVVSSPIFLKVFTKVQYSKNFNYILDPMNLPAWEVKLIKHFT